MPSANGVLPAEPAAAGMEQYPLQWPGHSIVWTSQAADTPAVAGTAVVASGVVVGATVAVVLTVLTPATRMLLLGFVTVVIRSARASRSLACTAKPDTTQSKANLLPYNLQKG